jgi:hypothetical protein
MVSQQAMQQWAQIPHVILPIYLNNPKRPLWPQSSGGYIPAMKMQLGNGQNAIPQEISPVSVPNFGSNACPENWTTFRRLYQYVLPWGCKISVKVKELWINNASGLSYVDSSNNVRWSIATEDPAIIGIIHQREVLSSQNPLQISPGETLNQIANQLQMSELHLVDAWTVKPVDYDNIWIQGQWTRQPGQVTESSARHSATLTTKYIKFYNLLKTLQPSASKSTYKNSNQWCIQTNTDVAAGNAFLAFLVIHFRPNLDCSAPIPQNSPTFYINYGIRFKIRIRYWLEFYQKIPADRIALSRTAASTDANTYEPWTLQNQAYYDAVYPELDPTANATVWSIRNTSIQQI